jgi:hypothetical protein
MKNLFVSQSMLRKGYSEEDFIMMTRNIKVVDLNGPKNINVKELRNKIVVSEDGMNLYGIKFCEIMAKIHNTDLNIERRIMSKTGIIIKEALRREFNI